MNSSAEPIKKPTDPDHKFIVETNKIRQNQLVSPHLQLQLQIQDLQNWLMLPRQKSIWKQTHVPNTHTNAMGTSKKLALPHQDHNFLEFTAEL